VAGNCSFKHPAPGSLYCRLCRQMLVQSCNKNVSLCLHDLRPYVPFLANMSVIRHYDGSLTTNILPLAAAYVCSSLAQAVKRRSAECSMCPASAQPRRMHCLYRQPSHQPSVSFICLPRSVATMSLCSRPLLSRSRLAVPRLS
jgi:hypothetical protein